MTSNQQFYLTGQSSRHRLSMMGTSQHLQGFCVFPRQKWQWKQWEQNAEICSHSDGMGTKQREMGTPQIGQGQSVTSAVPAVPIVPTKNK